MDGGSLPIAFALTVLAVVALGFLAVAAFAVTGLTRGRYQRLVEEDPKRAHALGDFVDRQAHYQLAFGAGRTLAVAGATLGATVVARSLDAEAQLALGVGTGALLLLAAHAAPRIVVSSRPEEALYNLAAPIRLAGLALTPLAWLLGLAVGLRARGRPRPAAGDDEERPSPEELRDIIGERVVEGVELDMIDGIFELEETTAREIMVPRMDVVALPVSASVRQALDVVIARGFSRLPVYDGTVDNVVGILYAKDLFSVVLAGGLDSHVGKYLRPAYFIPESKKIDDLLAELQGRRVHIAIVVDEYGGTAGLVTIEDLLEEIVGEIRDEFDSEEEKIVASGSGEATFDATVSIDDVNHTLDLALRGEEVDTIGGLVYERLGRVPQIGDEVTADGARIAVVSAAGRRIRRVKVTRVGAQPGAVADAG